jgi:hypothetical protein
MCRCRTFGSESNQEPTSSFCKQVLALVSESKYSLAALYVANYLTMEE